MTQVSQVTWRAEETLWAQGYLQVAGVDEAGRGSLAGPVVAAAVILAPGTNFAHVDDSKRLRREQREVLYELIMRQAKAVGVGYIEASVIDRINIRQGTLLAMQAALQQLGRCPDFLLIDGRDQLPANYRQRAVVRGDQTVGSIAAASIVAKVSRDRYMERLEHLYPGYGLAQHKGYGTATHLQALQALGPSRIHRLSFRGVVQTPQLEGRAS